MSALRAVVVSVAHPRCGYSLPSRRAFASHAEARSRVFRGALLLRHAHRAGGGGQRVFHGSWQHADHHAHQRGGAIANAVFDYVLIFGKFGFPAMGVAGAGYATALGTWASAFYGLYLVFQKKHESEYRVRSGWRYDADLMKRTLKFRRAERLAVGARGTRVQHFPRVHRAHEQRRCGARCQRDRGDGDDAGGASRLGCGPSRVGARRTAPGGKRPEKSEVATWSGLQVALMYILLVDLTFVLFPSFYLSWFYNPSNRNFGRRFAPSCRTC